MPCLRRTRCESGCPGEWKFGAAQGLKDVVFFDVWHWLSAGLILDGRLYRGGNEMQVRSVTGELPTSPEVKGKRGSGKATAAGW